MRIRNRQTTIKKAAELSGTGLHTGMAVRLEMLPAPDDTGIVFIRADVDPSFKIKAEIANLIATDHATVIGRGKCKVSTVEHLMASVYALGIDNIIFKMYGPEVPIMDGSALHFVKALASAGIDCGQQFCTTLNLKRKLVVKYGERAISIEPCDGLHVDYCIDFEHPMIKQQIFSSTITPGIFIKNICMSRTFGFIKDVETMKRHGLALGGSLDNAVVLDEEKVINPEGLRSPDEFVKHKVLDLIGDMAMTGFRINGRIKAVKAGHELHAMLVRKVLSTPSAWELSREDHPSWSYLLAGHRLMPSSASCSYGAM